MIFLAELNGLQLYAADVGNAYLEGKTKEKVCIYGGPEFRDLGLEGHLLVIVRALYGLKTSGCLLYTSPSPRDGLLSRMPSSA